MFRRKKQTEPINNGQEDGHAEQHNNEEKKSRFYRRFAQQELKGWSPIITGNVVVLYFLAVAVVCIALGVPILKAALDVDEYEIRYDDAGIMSGRSTGEQQDILMEQNGDGVTAVVNVTITKDMKPPVRTDTVTYTLKVPPKTRPCLQSCIQGQSLLYSPAQDGTEHPEFSGQIQFDFGSACLQVSFDL